MFLILIRRETEEGTLTWIDEGYNTTEEDKDTDISAYTEIFGTGNVRLVSSLEWEQEQEAVSLEKEEEEMARQKLRKQQESEYRKCLRADKQAESEERQNHPSIEELRRLRCQHFDFSNRCMTRSSKKKLGIRSKKV
jgi:hypothetical protein